MYLQNSSSSRLMGERFDFFSFNLMPVALQKSCRISEIFSASLNDPLLKSRISYTKSRWVMVRFVAILIPSNIPFLFASIIALLNPSATNKNKRGERGHPCLRPLSDRNKGEVDPYMRTAKDAMEMHAKIHFMKE